jgi:hypothetical protein
VRAAARTAVLQEVDRHLATRWDTLLDDSKRLVETLVHNVAELRANLWARRSLADYRRHHGLLAEDQ